MGSGESNELSWNTSHSVKADDNRTCPLSSDTLLPCLFSFSLLKYACMQTYIYLYIPKAAYVWVHTCEHAYVCRPGVSSLLPPCGSWRSHSGHWAWKHAPSPTHGATFSVPLQHILPSQWIVTFICEYVIKLILRCAMLNHCWFSSQALR